MEFRVCTSPRDYFTLHVAKDTSFDALILKISALLSQDNPNVSVVALECVDEDGDHITLRCHQDLQSLMEYNSSNQPLIINPRLANQGRDGAEDIARLRLSTYANLDMQSNGFSSSGSRPQSSTTHAPMDESFSSSLTSEGEFTPCTPNIDHPLQSPSLQRSHLKYLSNIGSGHFGTVFKVLHIPSGDIVAVKEVNLDVEEKVQHQIICEMEILRRCSSPYIIGFYGAFFHENSMHICCEWMDAGSLDRFGRIPEPILGAINRCVVDGLCYLWGNKIMHRDVKGSNILLNSSGETKLCDFGVSKQLERSMANTYCGTVAYLSPERIKGEDYGVHSDIWSLGITIYELAMGRLPFDMQRIGNNHARLLDEITQNPISQLCEDVFSNDLIMFVSACLERLPSKRPSPVSIKSYPLYLTYTDNHQATIAQWVSSKLLEVHADSMSMA